MSTCLKRPYTSVRQARERTQTLGNRLRVYVCADCGAYHVTNADRNKHHEPDLELPRPRPRLRRRPERAPERAAKLAAKTRDKWRCRWEGCAVEGRGLVHSAHLTAKGMGGDPRGRVSDQARDYVTLCPAHHRLLDTHVFDAFVTLARGDGPVEFRRRGRDNAP